MHPCLNVDEILRITAKELVASRVKGTAVALACCRRSFEDPVLDALWETQDRLLPLLKSLPRDAWEIKDGRFVSSGCPEVVVPFPHLTTPAVKSFNRIPTKAEWNRFRKYARGMRKLGVDARWDLITPEVFSTLQLRTGNDPLLPRLRIFKCGNVTQEFAPFLPLFLSHPTTDIDVAFTRDTSMVMVASTIARFPTWCPNVQSLTLKSLPPSPVIIEAVSEMVLACNRDTLQEFFVASPLTEEANSVLYKLPELRELWAVIRGPATLPPATLPNLTGIRVEYNHGEDWSQIFRGGTTGKLQTVTFMPSESAQIGNFLEEFESTTMSAQDTLSVFRLLTLQSWRPNYSALLVFKRLTTLEIDFSCRNGCSSGVNDDTVVCLAHAMPGLEILRLGQAPCSNPTGVALRGLVALARLCPQLSKLCVHLYVRKLVEMTTGTLPQFACEHTDAVPRTDCALKVLQVGQTLISSQSSSAVALTLVHLFPRICDIRYTNQQWRRVVETVGLFKKVNGHVHIASKCASPIPDWQLLISCEETNSRRNRHR